MKKKNASGKCENNRWLRSPSDSALCLQSLSAAKLSMSPSPKWSICPTRGLYYKWKYKYKYKKKYKYNVTITKMVDLPHKRFVLRIHVWRRRWRWWWSTANITKICLTRGEENCITNTNINAKINMMWPSPKWSTKGEQIEEITNTKITWPSNWVKL